MKFINYNGETIALCLAPPNWEEPLNLEIDLSGVTDVTRALSASRSPRQFARSSRYNFEFTIDTPPTIAQSDDAFFSTRLRMWLQRLKGETVAVPLWTDGVEISTAFNAGALLLNKTAINPVQYGAEWIIVNDDASIYEIVTVSLVDNVHVQLGAGAALNWPAGTMMFPLLFGIISSRPQFDAETDEVLNGRIGFQENSTFARRLNPFAGNIPVVGAGVANFSTTPLFDLEPDHVDLLDTTEVDQVLTQIGFLRQRQQQVYAQAVRRGLNMTFGLDGRDQIARLVRFFVDRYGPTKKFMTPTWRGDLRITQNLPQAPANHIAIEASDYTDGTRPAQPGDAYIALIDDVSVDPQKVTNAAVGDLTLAGAVTQVHLKSNTKLSHLVLSAFAESKLSLAYTSDDYAESKVKTIELPDEYAAPQAALPEPVKLFVFTEQMPTPLVSRFTNYEDTITIARGGPWDGVYTPAPFEDGDVDQTDDLTEEKIELTSFDFNLATNPLRKLLDFSLEGILSVDVLEADRNNLAGADPAPVFSGDAAGLDPQGKLWKATFRSFGQYFQRQFPRCYFQRICNVTLFSRKCGVLKANFLTDGTIFAMANATGGAYLDVAQIVGHANPAAKPTDYFAIGHFETGAGINYESRAVTHSEIVAGKLRIWFSKPLRKAANGQLINIYPGCDGSVESCRDLFNNLINMRAMPYMPDKNPTANIGEAQAETGGKK